MASARRLARCPTLSWRKLRARNVAILRAGLSGHDVRVLEPGPGAVPLVLPLLAEDGAHRERLRQARIARREFSTVLWHLEAREVGDEAASLSEQVLCIQVYQRYEDRDMNQVADVLREALMKCR
jgi:dTDP-4-amino-4,6-dideoxygalactose transaminase